MQKVCPSAYKLNNNLSAIGSVCFDKKKQTVHVLILVCSFADKDRKFGGLTQRCGVRKSSGTHSHMINIIVVSILRCSGFSSHARWSICPVLTNGRESNFGTLFCETSDSDHRTPHHFEIWHRTLVKSLSLSLSYIDHPTFHPYIQFLTSP